MKALSTTAAALSLTLAVSAIIHAQQEPGVAEAGMNWKKTGEQATFTYVYGKDALPDAAAIDNTDANVETASTPESMAAGMSSVMVTADGDVYESNMSPEDAAIFQRGIEALEKTGYSASLFSSGIEDTGGFVKKSDPGTDDEPDDAQTEMHDEIEPAADSATEVVIGRDDRRRVRNTRRVPFRNIGQFSTPSFGFCTGTLIGPKHVLTAGHCVSDGNGNLMQRNVTFSAGRNGNRRPWGSIRWTRILVPRAWHRNRDSNHDYALVVLARAPHGGRAAFATYRRAQHSISGYPGDKPAGTMWTHAGPTRPISPFRVCYTVDTAPGSSGSGLLDFKRIVHAIHTTGSPTRNCATRITPAVFANLRRWIAANR